MAGDALPGQVLVDDQLVWHGADVGFGVETLRECRRPRGKWPQIERGIELLPGVIVAVAIVLDPAPQVAQPGLGGCPPGEARITSGFRLPARWVIHTVGPVWRGGAYGERDVLASCYRACFALAAAHAVRSIAFPSISTGRYRFPIAEAVPIALHAITAELARRPELAEVRIVCFEEPVYGAYMAGLADLTRTPEETS